MTTAAMNIERAFVSHRNDVYTYLLRSTRNHHEAEELTQQTFADAFRALSRSAAPTSMRGLLLAIARRRFVDEVRRRTRAAELVERLVRTEGEAGGDMDGSLGLAIGRLPPEQRQVVLLRVVVGYTHREIAQLVGCDESACRTRFSRALRLLRNDLGASS